MPNKDRTGPRGEGPRTGSQRGNCPDKTLEVNPNECRKGNGQRPRGFKRGTNECRNKN